MKSYRQFLNEFYEPTVIDKLQDLFQMAKQGCFEAAERTIIAALLSVAITTPALTKDIVIRNNNGGYVVQYNLKVAQALRNNDRIKFAGRCDSACTLYLSVKNACVTPKANFGFHRPYGAGPKGNAAAEQLLMKSYPDWVRDWIRDNGGLTSGIKRMNYAYASKHLPTC